MNRRDFTERLEQALEGEVSPQVVHSNVQFYENYILDEMRKGRSESEILEELGDPRLIARTIFDSQEAAHGNYGGERYTYTEPEKERYGFGGEGSGEDRMDLSALWVKLKPTLIIAAVIIAVLVLISTLFSMALHVLMSPLFWIALAGWGIWRFFFR